MGGDALAKLIFEMLDLSSKKNYDFYHILSGQDMPLKSQDFIHDYFEKHKLNIIDCSGDINNSINRLKYYCFFYNAATNKRLGSFTNKIASKMSNLFVLIQKIINIDRTKSIREYLSKGETWCSLNNDFVQFVVNNKYYLDKYFINTRIPCEHYIQTLAKIYGQNLSKDYIWYIRWSDDASNHPDILNERDYDELIESGCIFARKLSTQNKLPKMIYNKIKNAN